MRLGPRDELGGSRHVEAGALAFEFLKAFHISRTLLKLLRADDGMPDLPISQAVSALLWSKMHSVA
jgi:hypothetical protein